MVKKLEMHPEHILRLGLGLVLVYMGFYTFFDGGESFSAYVTFFSFLPNIEFFVKIFSVFQIIAGICFLAGLLLRTISFVIFWEFLLGLIIGGADISTYKDFGLMTSALALFVLSKKTPSLKN
ncbi:MAG: hypothetical protein AB1333_01685 [Patescibacteria group bacterium]